MATINNALSVSDHLDFAGDDLIQAKQLLELAMANHRAGYASAEILEHTSTFITSALEHYRDAGLTPS